MATSDFKVLAYVPNLMEAARNYCARRESRFPYFREGYVDLGLGRHIHWTDAIREATEGYAVADKAGKVRQRYSSYVACLDAIAKVEHRQFEPELPAEEVTAPKSKAAAAGASA